MFFESEIDSDPKINGFITILAVSGDFASSVIVLDRELRSL